MNGIISDDYNAVPGKEPTHIVLGNGKLVKIDNYRYFIVVLVAIIIVIIVIVIFLIFAFQRNYDDVDPLPVETSASARSVGEEDNVGSTVTGFYHSRNDAINYMNETTCNDNPNAVWNKGRCICNRPYWGADCKQESHHPDYIGVGNYDDGDIEIQEIENYKTTRLSHPLSASELSCTDKCSRDPNCKGVIWKGKDRKNYNDKAECVLFREIKASSCGCLKYKNCESSTVYVKNTENIRFKNKVILYNGRLHRRFWMKEKIVGKDRTKDRSLLVMDLDRVYSLHFYPKNIINHEGATGYYSLGFFTNLPEGDFYRHDPGTPLKIPIKWAHRDIWVKYTLQN